MAEYAPVWFIERWRASLSIVLGHHQLSPVETAAAANHLWRDMEEAGWESQRLIGGERQSDGLLSPTRKVRTLVLPWE